MNRMIVALKVRAVLKDIYACSVCGVKALGTAYEYESERALPNLENAHCTPHDMPVGWASYGYSTSTGRRVFKCPACVKKECEQ